MSYSGYDIEDAIVLNKASLDRGFGRCLVMRRYSAALKKYANRACDRVGRPGGGAAAQARFRALDADGIAAPGEPLGQGECLVHKQVPLNTRDAQGAAGALPDAAFRPAPVMWKGHPGERAAVDRVLLSSNDEHFALVKVRRWWCLGGLGLW
jgi:DNA-directed RNA polymerase III subunit RPC2